MDKINYEKYGLAVDIIGCNIETYGHFEVYTIPDETETGISDEWAKANPNAFLQYVEDYYKNRKAINRDYGDDLKEQNATKRFLLSRVNKEKHKDLGMKWIKERIEV